ncbi:MAG: glycosyl hydrolase family 28-related protein [Candidatus Methylacidiphilales bacterium]
MQATSANTLSCSRLWGSSGELWTPEDRLPDFSWAGYHSGNDPLPDLPKGVNIKDFGAVGDGNHDDTDAFLKAISEVQGAIEIPTGRYVISKILEINRSNVVLRGESPDKSVLVCPVHLSDIRPDWGATTTGERTSNYSWSGGILWFKGERQTTALSSVQGSHKRGSRFIKVSTADSLSIKQRILIRQTDTPDNSLAAHLYSNDPGETRELKGSTTARLVCQIVSISGNQVEIDRPLRFGIKPEWKPELLAFNPDVTESGAENLGFEFPQTDYPGHFKELGHNAIALENVVDCWIKNIRIHNADSGIFGFGSLCSVVDVKFTCSRQPDVVSGCTGHHGVYFQGDDNLFTRFTYENTFIHDISISIGSGNVFSDGKGADLCFDHHIRLPTKTSSRIYIWAAAAAHGCAAVAGVSKHLPNGKEPDQLVCSTYQGDFPQYVPGGVADPSSNNSPGWMLLNFADEGSTAIGTDSEGEVYRYTLEVSADGKAWRRCVDRQDNIRDALHEYIQLDSPVTARYARLTNIRNVGFGTSHSCNALIMKNLIFSAKLSHS